MNRLNQPLITRLNTPFIRYTTAQTTLNAAAIAYANGGDTATTCLDVAKNFPLTAVVNSLYTKGVDYLTKQYGRLGANLFSLAITSSFYAYATLTNDTDPTIPTIAGGTVGIILTNIHVNEIQKAQEK